MWKFFEKIKERKTNLTDYISWPGSTLIDRYYTSTNLWTERRKIIKVASKDPINCCFISRHLAAVFGSKLTSWQSRTYFTKFSLNQTKKTYWITIIQNNSQLRIEFEGYPMALPEARQCCQTILTSQYQVQRSTQQQCCLATDYYTTFWSSIGAIKPCIQWPQSLWTSSPVIGIMS